MPRSQDRRKHLVQAALKLFASRGYYSTSIADILKESGCTKGVLYHYFPSKEELGYAAIEEAIRLILEQGTVSHLQTNEHPIDRFLRAVDTLPDVSGLGIPAYSTDIAIRMASVHEGFRRRLRQRLDALVQQTEEVARKGVADGQIADSVDPDQMVHLTVTVCAGIQFGNVLWARKAICEDARRWLREYLSSLRR
jgi:AcrR family transcriptional regulator